MIRGNHDALNVMSRGLPYPANVHEFSARGETKFIEDLQVALHGRSFAERGTKDEFLSGYRMRREGWLNIGVLHTSLEGDARPRPLRALHGRRTQGVRL